LSFFAFFPNSSEIQTSCLPVRSETNAIHFPFGDHLGSCSRQNVSVTRCTSPLSVATVKISPCVIIAARRFDGERSKASASPRTVRSRVSLSLSSDLIVTLISLLLPDAVSSFHNPKFSSYTIVRPSDEMLGK